MKQPVPGDSIKDTSQHQVIQAVTFSSPIVVEVTYLTFPKGHVYNYITIPIGSPAELPGIMESERIFVHGSLGWPPPTWNFEQTKIISRIASHMFLGKGYPP